MTIADMNKRVRNMLEYVTREQMQHVERQARIVALDKAIASGRYKRLTPEPSDSMDVDAAQAAIEEDVKPTLEKDDHITLNTKLEESSSKTSSLPSAESVSDNPTVAWMNLSTEEMLEDIVSGLFAFQDRYRPRNRRQTGATLAVA